MGEKRLLTADQVAEILQMKREWVYKHIPALKLPGRLKRFDPDVIANLGVEPSSLKTEEKAKPKGRKPVLEDLWS